MAVVAALDLDDQVAAGDRTHQVDGVHRRLGAGVARTATAAGRTARPASSATTMASSVGWAKWVPARPAPATAATMAGWAWPASDDAVAAVEVDVLAAVDVVDLASRAVGDPDRLRVGDLPVRGRAAGEVPGARRCSHGCAAGGRGTRLSSCSIRPSRRVAGRGGRAAAGWRSSKAPRAVRSERRSGRLTEGSVYATVAEGNKGSAPTGGEAGCRSAAGASAPSSGRSAWLAARPQGRARGRGPPRPAGLLAACGGSGSGTPSGAETIPAPDNPVTLAAEQGQPDDRVGTEPRARQHAAALQLRQLPRPAVPQGLRRAATTSRSGSRPSTTPTRR